MKPRYTEIAPRTALSNYIHCLWFFEGDESEIQRIVPDGRCELIVHCGAPYREVSGTRQPRALFAGQLTRPLHLKPVAHTGVIAVRFRMAGAFAFTHKPLSRFTDRRVTLANLHSRALASRLTREIGAAKTDKARANILQDYVAERIAEAPDGPDTVIEDCVARLSRGAKLDDLRRITGLAPRALQRRFARSVGVSPRMLASLIRFRRVFDALREADAQNWTEAAQAAGYFDHPQLARDFRRFVGCTARQFVRGGEGLAASLAAL